MRCCSGCAGYPAAERQFGSAVADGDLRRYHTKGPDATSRLLLTSMGEHLEPGDSVLDIGGGVGVLVFELLSKGASDATLVDASPAYLKAAEGEALRRAHSDRIRCVPGDFVAIADSVTAATVVTMHRVICCYPNHVALLQRAADHTRRVLAFSYPRDRWFVRWWLALENLWRRLSGSDFRTFVHSPAAMERIVVGAGFRRLSRHLTLVWSIDLYERTHSA
jgi:magnesium-protoporphyrin O-methyltransferase